MSKTSKFGMSGHLQVLSELLRRGYNVAIPLVDTGDDGVVIDDTDHLLYRLQVKSSNPLSSPNPELRLSFRFGVKREQLRDQSGAELYYMFMAWAWDGWEWLIIPRATLSAYKEKEEARAASVKRAGRPRKPDDSARDPDVNVDITFSRSTPSGRATGAVLWKEESLSAFLRRWPQQWPEQPLSRT